jgi:thiamine-phosphate pyrophosphorylase
MSTRPPATDIGLFGEPLPEHYLITPEPGADIAAFLARLDAALAAGIRLVQLRTKSLDAAAYATLARDATDICHAHGARLILNGPLTDPDAVSADGVHLGSARLLASTTRPLAMTKLVSAACHTARELAHAESIGVDFVTLSPVSTTATHPDAVPLGWDRFAELATSVHTPVYALGGMTKRDVVRARSYGACGIAAIRDLW